MDENHMNYDPAALRIGNNQPVALRWFVKAGPPGTINSPTLQYARAWQASDGSSGGVEWVDVPMVREEDESGAAAIRAQGSKA